jgi:hypothetical protein
MVAWLCGCSKVNESANGAVNFTRLLFFGLEHMQERVQLFCDAAARWFHPNALCEMPTRLSFIRFPVLRRMAELALVFENKTPHLHCVK